MTPHDRQHFRAGIFWMSGAGVASLLAGFCWACGHALATWAWDRLFG